MTSRAGLVTLAGAASVYVTAETLPVGLVPQLSAGLHVRPGTVGLLLSGYAAMAGLTAIPLTAAIGHRDRRQIVTGCVALLALSQFVIAAAPDYATVFAARLVCATAHGVFWSMLSPVAARLAAPGRAGRATAMVFTGNSLALVLGVPLGTALGHVTGWRPAMAALGAVAVVSAIAVRRVLPRLPAASSGLPGTAASSGLPGTAASSGLPGTAASSGLPVAAEAAAPSGAAAGTLRARLQAIPAALRSAPLLAICAVTVLVVTGHFTAYTYITELVRRDAHVTGLALPAVLFGYGGAGIAGIWLAGRITDRRPRRATAACAAGVVVALTVLISARSAAVTVAAVLVWGASFTALPVTLQGAVLRVAPRSADTASALYVVAFQIGIGGGALAGALLVDADLLTALCVVGAALAAAGLLLTVTARRAFPGDGAWRGQARQARSRPSRPAIAADTRLADRLFAVPSRESLTPAAAEAGGEGTSRTLREGDRESGRRRPPGRVRDLLSRAGGRGPARWRRVRRILASGPATVSAMAKQAWADRVFGLAAEAAFWALLSLTPLLLVLVATVGYLTPLFGAHLVVNLERDILRGAGHFVAPAAVQNILQPVLTNVLQHGRGRIISLSFPLALWTGSTAMNTYVNTITISYGMRHVRSALRARLVSFVLYLGALIAGTVVLPLLVTTPGWIIDVAPGAVLSVLKPVVAIAYWPVLILLCTGLLATLYHVAVPVRGRWRRDLPGAVAAMAIWLGSSLLLRAYLDFAIDRSPTYGALSAPVAILLFLYFAALAVLLGAELNAQIAGCRHDAPPDVAPGDAAPGDAAPGDA